MEDDDDEEINSESRASPPPNDRKTATATATPPQDNQQPRATGHDGDEVKDQWSRGETLVLIGAWGEKYLEREREGKCYSLWPEVAKIVSTKTPKTPVQCKNKFDRLRRRYKAEKSGVAAAGGDGGGAGDWPLFREKLDRLFGPTEKTSCGVQFQEQEQKLLKSGSESPWSESTQTVKFGGGKQGREKRNPLSESAESSHRAKRARIHQESNWDRNWNQGAKFTGGNQGREKNTGNWDWNWNQDAKFRGGNQGREETSPWESSDGLPPAKRAEVRQELNQNRNVKSGRGNQGRERNSQSESSDGLPPVNRARSRRELNWNWNHGAKLTGGNQGREKSWGSCVGEVSRAIENFGKVYERVENSKVKQLGELEKQRMEFTKDLELKRMQFFMDFQLELSQRNRNRRIEHSNEQQQNGEEDSDSSS